MCFGLTSPVPRRHSHRAQPVGVAVSDPSSFILVSFLPFRPPPSPFTIPAVKAAIWAKRLPWSVPAAAVPLVLLGWLAIARCEDFDPAAGITSASKSFGRCSAWSPWRRSRCPTTACCAGGATCCFWRRWGCWWRPTFFPPIHGTHRWIRAGPDRLSALRVCQGGLRAGAGPLLDVSPDLSAAGRLAVAAGAGPGAAGVGLDRARPGHGDALPPGALRHALCRRGAAARPGDRSWRPAC